MKLVVVCGAFFFAIGIAAQEKKWTLVECVTYAIDNNLSIEQYELDFENILLEKSDAIGNMLPSLNGSMNVSRNTGLVIEPTTNNYVSGTILSASGNISSSVTLFDGLRNINTLNRAKLNALAGQYRLDDLKDDIRLFVANTYLQVLSNKESLKVAKAQYKIYIQDQKKTKELVESGVVPKGDLLEIEATVANQEFEIVNRENAVLIARINLAQLLQITDYVNFDIADEEFQVPPSDILSNSPKVIFDKALTFRNDIKYSQSGVAIARKDLEIAKGALYPSISAFVNYNTRYSDQNYDRVTGQLIGFKDQLWSNDGISYGAQLSIPVFNGFRVKNNVKRSKIGVKKAELQFEQDKLDLETSINQAYVDVKGAGKSYEAAQKALQARVGAFEYSKERFNVGLMNAFDYSQVQSRVDNAEAEVIRKKYDYIFKLKVLEFYFGLPLTMN
ncbi:MAG: TolC family protein [Cellulophaga sp.]